jgi:hypothetical protein
VTLADQELIRRYLFGELKGDEKDRFEERYFEEDALLEEILRVERQLADAYSAGTLPIRERARLERGRGSSVRWRTLLQNAAKRRRRQRLTWCAAGLAAMLAFAICGYLALRPREASVRVAQPQSQQAVSGVEITHVLQAQRLRNVEAPRPLVVAANVATVNLRAEGLRQNFLHYDAVLSTHGGAAVSRLSGLRSEADREGGQSVVIPVPGARLLVGDYILTLTGVPESGEPQEVEVYTFRVERPQ